MARAVPAANRATRVLRIWAGIGGGLLIIGSGLLIVGTVAEDVATLGVGVLDDPFTIGGGIAGIGAGSSLVASMFALAA